MLPHHLSNNAIRYASRLAIMCLCCLCAPQLRGQQHAATFDSMERALDTAKDGATKVRLRYHIGVAKNIFALGYWDSLIHAAHEAGDMEMEVSCTDRLGFYQMLQGDIKKAISYFNKAISVAGTMDNKEHLFAPLYHISEAYYLLGDIKNALDYAHKTVRNAEECDNKRNIATSYTMLGKIYARIGYAQRAVKWHLKALKFSTDNNLAADMISLSLYCAGNAYDDLRDTANAQKYYYRCEPYIDSLVPSALQAGLYNAVGSAYEMNGNLDKAEAYYLASYNVSKEIESKITTVTTLTFLANNAYYKNNTRQARAYATEALQMAKAIKSKIHIPKIVLLLSRVYQKEKNYKEAFRYSEMYQLYQDSLTSENIQNQAIEKEYHDEIEQKEYKNRLLIEQNRIQHLLLQQKRYLMAGLQLGIVLVTVIFIMLVRQNRIKSDRQKIELEQKLLRTQMNPHFIFNALQAIQNIVLNNDKKQAVKYLSLFAGLTREVLNNSRADMISIEKEIALVEHYLQLQRLRFDGKFEYTIYRQDDIGDNMLVPPMLGQPFIENAVEHGMRNIEAGGHITVSYTQANGMLYIQITDNGYGMNATRRNNRQHQSMAIAITKERIEMMNKRQKIRAGFEIKDAFPDESERKGVCVMFSLPVSLISGAQHKNSPGHSILKNEYTHG